jgi:hypothetical protein
MESLSRCACRGYTIPERLRGRGAVLIHRPHYVREWILRERDERYGREFRMAPDSFACVQTIEYA